MQVAPGPVVADPAVLNFRHVRAEIRLLEAENSAAVDLFDPRHAKKVKISDLSCANVSGAACGNCHAADGIEQRVASDVGVVGDVRARSDRSSVPY